MKKINILIIILSFFTFSGCGLKSAPLPPKVKLYAPDNLELKKEDKGYLIFWEYKNPLPSGGFRLYRANIDKSCKDCPYNYSLIAELKKEERQYRDKDAEGEKIAYKLKAFLKSGAEGPSSVILSFKEEE